MKKLISLLLILILCVCSCVVSAAENVYGVAKPQSFVSVRVDSEIGYSITGRYTNMINNPYYKINYNKLINKSYNVYLNGWQQENKEEYIAAYVEDYMQYPKNYVTLIFKPASNTDFEPESYRIYTYNVKILMKYFDEDDIIYVGEDSYAAIVCVDNLYTDVILQIKELEFIGDAFFTDTEASAIQIPGIYALGNVVASTDFSQGETTVEKPNAADARLLLRYAAGLERGEMSKQFYFCADVNFDGKISAKDARSVLRMAASLDPLMYISYMDYRSWFESV